MGTAQRITTTLLIIFGTILFGLFISVLLLTTTKQPAVLSATDSSLFYYFSSTERNCIYNLSIMNGGRYLVVDSVASPPLTAAERGDIVSLCYGNYSIPRMYFQQHYFQGIDAVKPWITDCWVGKIGSERYQQIRYNGSPISSGEDNDLIHCYQNATPPDGNDPNEPPDSTTPPPDTTDPDSSTTDSSGDQTYVTYGERYPAGSSKRECIKKVLGGDFAWFNNKANPNAAGEYKRFESLEKKAIECFQTYPPPASTYEPKLFLTPEMVACLKNAFGETRFKEISSGKFNPTPLEGEKLQTCHAKFYETGRPTVEYQTATTLDENTESCLKIAVGAKRYKKISSGTSLPTFTELYKGSECFGASSSPLAPPPVLKVSSKIASCIESAVSKDRLAKIKSGEVEPTDAERSKVSACFNKINKTQLAFLPLPPEQVPFLAVDKTKVSINKAETKYVKDKSGKERPVVTFSGKGLPKATVDLYFFSDPVVVTLNTDANGDWTYNLDAPLDNGDHIAYVTAKTGGGEAVRSEVFRFSVAQAAASGDREGGLIVKSTNFRDQVIGYLVWVVGLVVVGVVALGTIVVYRGRRKARAATTQQPGKQS